MGTTPVYALPYQGVNDSPNGPVLGQALAEAVEARLVSTDADVAALETQLAGYTTVVEGVQSTATIGLTTSNQDLTGATVNVTTNGANRVVEIVATVDGESSGTTNIGVVTCVVGATTLPGELHWGPTGRASYSRKWRYVIAAAGTYAVKLQGLKTGNTNNFTTYATHTNVVATVHNPLP